MRFFSLVISAVAATVLLLSGQPATAQETTISCASIENADERLACYDRVAENARNLPVVRVPRTGRSEPTEEPVRRQTPAVTTRQDDFGLEQKQERRQDSGPRERTYRVLAASHNDFTGWTIEFEGGGTWKQVGTDDYDIDVGETYTVRRTSFNSFMLSNSRNNRKIRITRYE